MFVNIGIFVQTVPVAGYPKVVHETAPGADPGIRKGAQLLSFLHRVPEPDGCGEDKELSFRLCTDDRTGEKDQQAVWISKGS